MAKQTVLTALVLFFFAGACFFNAGATSKLMESQPKWYFLNAHSYKNFAQIIAVGFGVRAFMADIYYISFLQYYGDRANAKKDYDKLTNYLYDITETDPYFTFAYSFGAAILAFNHNRFDEAVKFIEYGKSMLSKKDPVFWKLNMYLGAIGYKQAGNKEEYIKSLEAVLAYEDHPAIIERLLGNIYEQVKTPDESAAYWLKIFKTTKDKSTRNFAYNRIMAIAASGKLKNPAALEF